MTHTWGDDEIFDSISKAVRGQAQRCNACGQVSKMKDTNVCKKCRENTGKGKVGE